MNHYDVNQKLLIEHGFRLYDLDQMLPYEREIYIQMLNMHIEKENARRNNGN